ncbi:hypothetical protein ACRQ5D_34275 [Mucilaginibacter sp. P25]|uniref:hypothetical protein n=1 Tax=Mucilaginibacter sp. P25 TaxID=3423945 RepID=UPI003D7C07AE
MSESDLATLINFSTNDIINIINGKKGIVLLTAEKISKVFGRRYFELGNPNFPISTEDDLPQSTKIAISLRESKGQPKKYSDHKLGKNLDSIIGTSFLHVPRTSQEMFDQLPENVKTEIKSHHRVTDLMQKPKKQKLVATIISEDDQLTFQLREYAPKDNILNIKPVSKKSKGNHGK